MADQLQKILTRDQIEAFHIEAFAKDQVHQFISMVGSEFGSKLVVVDVGGGIGCFAQRLQEQAGHQLRVIDIDPNSIAICARVGVKCAVGDALNPQFAGDEQMASFNMMLHHLVGASESVTRALQSRALHAWHSRARRLFVNEYIYESYVGNFSGWLIFQITKSRVLSWIGRMVSVIVPSLRANTFGVGVRFRATEEWRGLFLGAGFRVANYIEGEDEPVSLPERLLLIKHRRRDSFLLEPVSMLAG